MTESLPAAIRYAPIDVRLQVGCLLALLETIIVVLVAYFATPWTLVAGLVVVCATMVRSFRVDFVMSRRVVLVTNVLSRHRIAWSEVQSIIAKSVPLTPSDERCLHLVLRDGRRVPILVTFWPGRERAIELSHTIKRYCPQGVQLEFDLPRPGRDFGLRPTSSWQPPGSPH